jgi:hypothetical protein
VGAVERLERERIAPEVRPRVRALARHLTTRMRKRPDL